MASEVTSKVEKMSLKEEKKKNNKEKNGENSVAELSPWPSFIQDRLNLWDKLKTEYEKDLSEKPNVDIKVTLPDGKEIVGKSWKTTPYEIASGISQGLADTAVISKVNNELWDLDRPLEGDCQLAILKFDDDEAKQVFWHSSAHILGESLERVYGGCLCYGPPIENGFYYDMFLEGKGVSNYDFPCLENVSKKIVKEKQSFERLEMKKEDLLEMFKYNPFKVRILNEKVTTPTTTVYRCGPLIDLCRGPHVRHTGKIKAMKVTKNSAAYWEGNQKAETLQRVYGISFPDPKQLKEWEKFQAEAAERDHRKIGVDRELFFFHELAPGAAFFHPKGAHIYNTLIEFLRSEYKKRDFQEVISPNLYKTKLWETSEHWKHYGENMYTLDIDNEKYGLKPMNCPGHCIIFDYRARNYHEMPLRMADFGVLHRNEVSGSLTGLIRVRRFQQDDAHIFCSSKQMKSEIAGALEFLRHVYEIFGFTFKLNLSTRPEKYTGTLKDWDYAENILQECLNEFGAPWKLNSQDGAFYGPKIDVTIMDALKRNHQCGTIQLDFSNPEKFNLNFMNENGEKERPVIIHRAILGSFERMIAILTESYGGKWPFWLSPRQAMILPVHPKYDDYAYEVKKKLHEAHFKVDVDADPTDTLNKRVRNAQLAQYNFILVVGEKEQSGGSVNMRTRDNVVHGEIGVEDLLKKFQLLKETKEI